MISFIISSWTSQLTTLLPSFLIPKREKIIIATILLHRVVVTESDGIIKPKLIQSFIVTLLVGKYLPVFNSARLAT